MILKIKLDNDYNLISYEYVDIRNGDLLDKEIRWIEDGYSVASNKYIYLDPENYVNTIYSLPNLTNSIKLVLREHKLNKLLS